MEFWYAGKFVQFFTKLQFLKILFTIFFVLDSHLILIAMDESNRLSFWSVSHRKAMTIELSGLNFW